MPQHDVGLYSAVVDDATKSEPMVTPLAVDTRIKVVGLSKAAQYNGQSGVVKGFDREAGRYEVVLKNGKELKIKRDNMELLDGAIKGGFLSQVPAAARSSAPPSTLLGRPTSDRARTEGLQAVLSQRSHCALVLHRASHPSLQLAEAPRLYARRGRRRACLTA